MVKKTHPSIVIGLLVLSLLTSLVVSSPAAHALFGYDEFTDDSPQLIQETTESDSGGSCNSCNISIWINYPNGSKYGNFYMKYNVSASKWQKELNLTLVNENTTIYGVTINGTLSVASNIRNATSDRTQITIYDIWPQVDSQWDVGLVIMLLVIQWVFVLLAYRFQEEHVMVRYGFIAIALFFNGWLMAFAHRLLVINGVVTTNFTNLFESTEILAIVINYIFTAYIFIYLIYYIIHNVMDSARKIKGGRER